MDPISAVVFGIVQDFAVSYVAGILANLTTDHEPDPRVQRNRERARDAVADLITDSLVPLFPPATPEQDARLVVDRLKAALAEYPLTPELLLQHGHRAGPIVVAIAGETEDTGDARFDDLQRLYRSALTTVAERYVEIGPNLPEWQRAQWDRNFEVLKRVDGNVQVVRDLLVAQRAEPEREAEAFEEAYRKSVAATNAHIRLLGVPAPMPVDLHLDTAFVDLQLGVLRLSAALPDDEDRDHLATLDEMCKRFEQRFGMTGEGDGRSLGAYLAQYPRLVIVGVPGSGKTTLMQRLTFCAAERRLGELCPALPGGLVPFLFRVRALDLEHLPTPEEFVEHLASNLAAVYPKGWVTQVLIEGRALVLVDGLDECEPAQHERLMEWVAGLGRDFGAARFLLTSRPAGYKSGELVTCDFAEAELQPLSPEQRDGFVRQWYRAAKTPVPGEVASGDAETSAADLIGRIARTPSIHFMATNPLLLSVICVVHRYRGEKIPERRADLLKHCVDVLISEWRSAKQGLPKSLLSDLNTVELTALVRPLAWRMMEEGKAEAPRETVAQVFAKALPGLGERAERAEELLDHIRDQSGLLVEQRPGVYAFAHLIFQEYLAAEQAATMSPDVLLHRARDDHWQEVIPLYAGLPSAGPEALVRALLQMGLDVLAGRCVAAAIQLSPELREEVVRKLFESMPPRADDALVEIGGSIVTRAGIQRIVTAGADAKALTAAESADWSFAWDDFWSAALSVARRAAGSAAESAARSATRSAAGSAAERAAGDAAASAAERVAGGYAEAPAEITARSAARSAAGSAARSAAGSAAVLERLGAEDLRRELSETTVTSQSRPETRLYLWCPLAEFIEPGSSDFADEQLSALPGDVFPLLRLCVLRRLEHRWEGRLPENQSARLAELIRLAEANLEAHFHWFTDEVEKKMKRRKTTG